MNITNAPCYFFNNHQDAEDQERARAILATAKTVQAS